MLNILKSEILKLKKDAMFYTGTIISILMPILVIQKDKFLSSPPDNLMDWVMTCCLVDFLILSMLSGFCACLVRIGRLSRKGMPTSYWADSGRKESR